MTQNLVTLNLTDAQLTAVDAALGELETQLGALIALPPPQKKSLRRMGQKSEAFCRQTLRVVEQNPQMVPANVPLADAIADLGALEKLRPRMVRLSRLSERAADTEVALGSDVMSVALQGCRSRFALRYFSANGIAMDDTPVASGFKTSSCKRRTGTGCDQDTGTTSGPPRNASSREGRLRLAGARTLSLSGSQSAQFLVRRRRFRRSASRLGDFLREEA